MEILIQHGSTNTTALNKAIKKLESSDKMYGVFYKDGYCDLYTNDRKNAIESHLYIAPELRGFILKK